MAKKKEITTVTTTSALRDFYPKDHVVRAIRWATGMPKLVAEKVYDETCIQFHNRTAYEYNMYGVGRSVRA